MGQVPLLMSVPVPAEHCWRRKGLRRTSSKDVGSSAKWGQALPRARVQSCTNWRNRDGLLGAGSCRRDYRDRHRSLDRVGLMKCLRVGGEKVWRVNHSGARVSYAWAAC